MIRQRAYRHVRARGRAPLARSARLTTVADTGAIYALLDRRDAWHERVRGWWESGTGEVLLPVTILPRDLVSGSAAQGDRGRDRLRAGGGGRRAHGRTPRAWRFRSERGADAGLPRPPPWLRGRDGGRGGGAVGRGFRTDHGPEALRDRPAAARGAAAAGARLGLRGS